MIQTRILLISNLDLQPEQFSFIVGLKMKTLIHSSSSSSLTPTLTLTLTLSVSLSLSLSLSLSHTLTYTHTHTKCARTYVGLTAMVFRVFRNLSRKGIARAWATRGNDCLLCRR